MNIINKSASIQEGGWRLGGDALGDRKWGRSRARSGCHGGGLLGGAGGHLFAGRLAGGSNDSPCAINLNLSRPVLGARRLEA